MRRIVAVVALAIVMGILLGLVVAPLCAAFENKTAIPEPVASKQRAERIIIRDVNGQPAITFILVYGNDGSPARFLVVDRENQVFFSASQGDGR